MKRCIVFVLVFVLPIVVVAGCGNAENMQPRGIRSGAGDGGRFSVVCTIFPQYDWVRQIIGDRSDMFDLTLFLDGNVDMHSYLPSVDDIVKVATCDLFIYIGGVSDGWVEDILMQAVNPDMAIIRLMGVLGEDAKQEEFVEGMENDDNEHGGNEHGGDDGEYDEHVWLSLRHAQIFCTAIANALIALDSGGAAVYRGNLAAYIQELSALDAEYQAVVNASPVRTLLCGDRFPFRYLADDYGISYYAAFPGCSAETEASFETIIFLSGKMDELHLNSVLVTESSNQTIAKTIIGNSQDKNQRICTLNSMQAVGLGDAAYPATYLSIMEGNLSVLREALG